VMGDEQEKTHWQKLKELIKMMENGEIDHIKIQDGLPVSAKIKEQNFNLTK